jgi:thiosulfate reductase cytochrome b subunit
MASAQRLPYVSSVSASSVAQPRHSAIVRVTHWVTTLCFLALLVTGIEILISHPRFYWGETGNVNMTPLFQFHIPSSRSSVPTGYGYVLPDQNGWSRYLHFQTAWIAVITALVYGVYGFISGHFRKNLLPESASLSWRSLSAAFSAHLRFNAAQTSSYNVLQRVAYLGVIFVLFPLVIWTGLAMSPAVVSAFPTIVTVLGGQQSARTLHFFVSVCLVAFLVIHVVMVSISGFKSRMRAMVTGNPSPSPTTTQKGKL